MITYLQLGRMGRLGNQMFEIASTIGIAVKSGQDFAFPYWMNHDAKERFGATEDIDIQKYFKNPLPLLDDPDRYNFTEWPYYWGYRHEHLPHGNYNLNAHMQSEKYFYHCKDLIKHYFEPADQYRHFPRDVVAVHLRFGDYDNHYHPHTTVEYLRQAISYFDYGRHFLVYSDDHEKASALCKIAFAGGHFPQFGVIKPRNTIYDFFEMMAAKDFIICNSTYSWWAAWLGKHPDKKVICPKKWHGDHTGLDPSDIYAENWIII